jgi:hypothetical protein
MKHALVIMALLTFGCKKNEESPKDEPKCLTNANQECSNGDLAISNKINDTITYRTNIDHIARKLPPGATGHLATGRIAAVYNSDCVRGSGQMIGVEITIIGKTSRYIDVDHCAESWEYRYKAGSTQNGELVDVTDYSK